MPLQYITTCVLCPTKIPAKYKLCSLHFFQYKDYIGTDWFNVLLKEQKKQDAIDRRERYSFPFDRTTDIYGLRHDIELLSKRKVGRPSTDWRIIERILLIYDASMEDVLQNKTRRVKSLRQIAREVDQIVDHCTIANILNVYRKKK